MSSVKKITFLLFFIFLFNSCGDKLNEETKNNNISVTDFRNKEIRLKKPVQKAICLIESALSGIYMLEAGSSIIAVPSAVYDENLSAYYSKLDKRIKENKLPSPGNWDFVSIEKIIDLNPDLVIIWASQVEAIEAIEKLNIPVYAVMLNNFNNIYKEISDFGILFNKNARADSLIAYAKENLNAIKKRNSIVKRKSVYFMWAQAINETSGKNSTVEELLNFANVINVCDFSQEHVAISIEKIYDWNPDLIIMWYNENLNPGDIINNPLLKNLKAIKNKQVFELPEIFACDFWTLKMLNAVNLISTWAYPSESDTSFSLDNVYKYLYNTEL